MGGVRPEVQLYIILDYKPEKGRFLSPTFAYKIPGSLLTDSKKILTRSVTVIKEIIGQIQSPMIRRIVRKGTISTELQPHLRYHI